MASAHGRAARRPRRACLVNPAIDVLSDEAKRPVWATDPDRRNPPAAQQGRADRHARRDPPLLPANVNIDGGLGEHGYE